LGIIGPEWIESKEKATLSIQCGLSKRYWDSLLLGWEDLSKKGFQFQP
jgi:hypothetical protein